VSCQVSGVAKLRRYIGFLQGMTEGVTKFREAKEKRDTTDET